MRCATCTPRCSACRSCARSRAERPRSSRPSLLPVVRPDMPSWFRMKRTSALVGNDGKNCKRVSSAASSQGCCAAKPGVSGFCFLSCLAALDISRCNHLGSGGMLPVLDPCAGYLMVAVRVWAPLAVRHSERPTTMCACRDNGESKWPRAERQPCEAGGGGGGWGTSHLALATSPPRPAGSTGPRPNAVDAGSAVAARGAAASSASASPGQQRFAAGRPQPLPACGAGTPDCLSMPSTAGGRPTVSLLPWARHCIARLGLRITEGRLCALPP
mmetsp:Transcript_96392/g.267775  ORF Transcript_96392/g.267775 Transcript_96392/m.267775 type:complete len:272 (-) Transcript_96392:34-849(-)